ncbi:MAG: glycosyltransferase, partial [Bacteroidales bacterium]|nr:glycosyltransferase [Bacteroidales bacterium]
HQPSAINLLSIGRFSNQKNFDNLPDICKKALELLKDRNISLRWYIIGFGADENLIRQKIAEAGMQDHVIILGKKENPYPYVKACDIYVQPSRYEGKSVTVREAQMLCKPVVVTNYPTASSQIQDGVDGVIVPMDNEGCAKGLAEFILDEIKQSQIVEYLKTHDYGNMNEVNKIYSILGL